MEKSVQRLIQELQTTEDYGYLLGLFYSYFGGLEVLIERRDIEKYLPDYHERRKAKLLSDDLLNLKMADPDVCRQEFLPLMGNSFRALGALYVMEGSTLGGVYIMKMIQRKLSGNRDSYHFFFRLWRPERVDVGPV